MTSMRFDDYQELFFREGARQVRRLAFRYDLQPADRDDLFQEFALDGWSRLKDYRASRGELGAFLGVVMLHQACKIEGRLCRRRRNSEVSLDAPFTSRASDDELSLAETLSEHEGLAALLGNPVDGHARVDLMLELVRVLGRLPEDLRKLCTCLAHEPPAVARCVCGLSNTGLYRRIEELRLHLLAFNFGTP